MLSDGQQTPATRLGRREWLRLSASSLLALGLWPGCARWRDNGRGGSFSFVVLNDAHFQSAQCGPWFEKVRASIRQHQPRPEFCLMVGDLAEHGTKAELGPMKEALQSFGMGFYAVIGNHDYVSDTDRSAWDALFPGSINYSFRHRGWQFIGLDSTQGTKWENTRIPEETFRWVDEKLPRLDVAAPTVVFTHFPLGEGVRMRPSNADELLKKFKSFNLTAVFNGHFHGFTERELGPTVLTTNRCCAISRGNHDGTKEKGYFLCKATTGRITREFVEVKPE
jgi:3',5'-cyclic AMP phosphodiesterase CpdA